MGKHTVIRQRPTYAHCRETDAVLEAGWPGGEVQEELLRQCNAVLTALPFPTEPMSQAIMMKRVRVLRLQRGSTHRSEMLSIAYHARRGKTDNAHYVAPPLEGEGVLPADMLRPLRDGAPSTVMRGFALEMRENARCRIDRESAFEWGKRWRAGNTIESINERRAAYNLPVFEIS
jgi:hypothetical protein